MRLFSTIIACLCALQFAVVASAETVPVSLDAETEALLSEAALARYSSPGETVRYKSLLEALRQPAETLGTPARNLRLPVRTFEDGRPQVVVTAVEAWITLDTNLLRGRKVHVEQYREDGSLEAVLDADEAMVNRAEMLAVAKGKVHGMMDGDALTGVGALVDLEAKYLRIIKRGCIKTKRMAGANFTDRGIF